MKWSSLMILAMGLVIGLSLGLLLKPLIAAEDEVKVAIWLEVVHRLCTSVGGLGTFFALIIVMRQFHLLRTQSDGPSYIICATWDSPSTKKSTSTMSGINS